MQTLAFWAISISFGYTKAIETTISETQHSVYKYIHSNISATKLWWYILQGLYSYILVYTRWTCTERWMLWRKAQSTNVNNTLGQPQSHKDIYTCIHVTNVRMHAPFHRIVYLFDLYEWSFVLIFVQRIYRIEVYIYGMSSLSLYEREARFVCHSERDKLTLTREHKGLWVYWVYTTSAKDKPFALCLGYIFL